MRTAVLIAVLMLPPARAAAQDPAGLTQDARLRVTTSSTAKLIGTYQALTDTSLVLSSGAAPLVIPLSSIEYLEQSRGRKLSVAGGIAGFLVGGIAGSLIACSANRDSYGVFCGGQNDTKVVAGAVLGGVTGGALGAVLFRRERWRPIDVSLLRR